MKEFKRAEKAYNERLKVQKDEIIRLEGEIMRIKNLVRKFLTPEQFKLIASSNGGQTMQGGEVTVQGESTDRKQVLTDSKLEDGLSELTLEMIDENPAEGGKKGGMNTVASHRADRERDGDLMNVVMSTQKKKSIATARLSDVH